MKFRELGVPALLVLVLVVYVALFARTIEQGFVWDDVHEIEGNPLFDGPLLDGLAVTQTERTDASMTEIQELRLSYDSYRPLLFTSYWVDVKSWGKGPGPLHTTSLVLGALTILVAYAVGRRWLGDPLLAIIPASFLALHPVQVETIAYISARGDLLAGLFALCATYAALRALKAERPATAVWTVLGTFAFAGSLLSKEAYIGLPAATAVIAWSIGRLRSRWWVPAAQAAALGGYLVLRSIVVTDTSSGAIREALIALPGIWLEYLRIALLPFDLSTERLHRTDFAVAGWVAVGLAVVLAGYLVRRKREPLDPAIRAGLSGLAWFAILLGPSAIPVVSAGVAADRYAYASLFGFGIAIAAFTRHAIRARPKLRIPIVGAGVVWAALCLRIGWSQVPVWADNITLYTHAVVMTPESSSAHYRLAYLDAQAGRWDEAIPRLEHALELDSRNLRALNNLGVGYLRTGRFVEAEQTLVRAVEVNSVHFRALFNLGVARLNLGKRSDACLSIQRALQINPHYAAAAAELQRSCLAP